MVATKFSIFCWNALNNFTFFTLIKLFCSQTEFNIGKFASQNYCLICVAIKKENLLIIINNFAFDFGEVVIPNTSKEKTL